MDVRNLLNPQGDWSNVTVYSAKIISGPTFDGPLIVSCPRVNYTDGNTYYYPSQTPSTAGVTPPTVGSGWIADGSSSGSGDTVISFVPTLTSSVPGNLNVTYTVQTGTIITIDKIATINFDVEGSFTNTTGTGPIAIVAPELNALDTAEYVRATLNYTLKSPTLHTAGYTGYVSYMNGTQIWVEAQTTDPLLLNVPVQIQDLTSPSSFVLQGQIIVPLN